MGLGVTRIHCSLLLFAVSFSILTIALHIFIEQRAVHLKAPIKRAILHCSNLALT